MLVIVLAQRSVSTLFAALRNVKEQNKTVFWSRRGKISQLSRPFAKVLIIQQVGSVTIQMRYIKPIPSSTLLAQLSSRGNTSMLYINSFTIRM